MPILVDQLTYTYNFGTSLAMTAFKDISFSVEAGDWVSIVGHTGSGKSTLVQHLNGLLFACGGSVHVDGILVREKDRSLKEIRKKVGLVFQYPEQQLFAETVWEEIAFGPRNWGVPEEDLKQCVAKALDWVGLPPEMDLKNPFELSGGQKRKIAIASVLAASPDYIVLDEPTAGLDARGSRELINMLQSFRQRGIATVHVTHDLELAFRTSHKILVLDKMGSPLWGSPEYIAEKLLNNIIEGMSLPPALEIVRGLRNRGIEFPAVWDVTRLADLLEEIDPSCNSQIN